MAISTSEAEKLLGLSGLYTDADIDRAFKCFAKKYHPDVCQSKGIDLEIATQMMVMAAEARELLKYVVNSSFDYSYAAAEKTCRPSPASKPVPVYDCEPVKETSPTKPVTEHAFIKKVLSVVYNSERMCGSVWFSFLLLVTGWTLPFYLFGGLNIIPSWSGIFPVDGWSFLFGYLVVPAVALLNFISPFHFINMAVRGIVMLILFPVKKVFAC